MQLKLETNVPLIFLTLLVILIVVLGYLELKKINERIKILEYQNREKNKDSNKDINKNINKKDYIDEWQNNNEKIKTDNLNNDIENNISRNNGYIIQENDSIKNKIINQLNKNETFNNDEEYNNYFGEDQIDDNIDNIVKDYNYMKVNQHLDDKELPKNELINDDNINLDDDDNINLNDDIINLDDDDDDNNIDDNIIDGIKLEDDKDIKSNIDKNIDDNKSETSEISEIINLKEINDEEDFEKEKIVVDESYSVNQLKTICKNLGLQLSGNKTTLIKRIMENQ